MTTDLEALARAATPPIEELERVCRDGLAPTPAQRDSFFLPIDFAITVTPSVVLALLARLKEAERAAADWEDIARAIDRDRDQKAAIISQIDKRSGTLPKPSTIARRRLKERNHPAFRREKR